VAALQLNLFLRHAGTVRMANIAQVVNVIAPVFTNTDGLFLQTIFYPFELYSRTCGRYTVDTRFSGETFSAGDYKGVPTLDVAATIDEAKRQLVLYAVNRSRHRYTETEIKLTSGLFTDKATVYVINGPDIESENSFEKPDEVVPTQYSVETKEKSMTFSFEPHSVTAMVFSIR
jgi:alpha-N-arabinofuranosidase